MKKREDFLLNRVPRRTAQELYAKLGGRKIPNWVLVRNQLLMDERMAKLIEYYDKPRKKTGSTINVVVRQKYHPQHLL